MFENAYQSIDYATDQEKVDFLKNQSAAISYRMTFLQNRRDRTERAAAVVKYSSMRRDDIEYYIVPGMAQAVPEEEFLKDYFKAKSKYGHAIPRVGNETLIRKIEKWTEQYHALSAQRDKVATEYKVLFKKVAQTSQLDAANVIPKSVVTDQSKIPHKIFWTPKNKFGNPYWINPNSLSAYAGTPEHYHDWTSRQIEHYQTIVDALTRNGYSRPDMMYAARYPTGNHDINFVILANNGKFIWRRYGTGAGLQNWVYINGHKMNTLTFTSAAKADQDHYLQSMKS